MNNFLKVTILSWLVSSFAIAMTPCDQAFSSNPIKSSFGTNIMFESAVWRGRDQMVADTDGRRVKLVDQNRKRVESMTIEIPLEKSLMMRSVTLFSALLENYDLAEFVYVEVQKLNVCSAAFQTFGLFNNCMTGVATFMDHQFKPVRAEIGDVMVVSRKNSLIYAIYHTWKDVTEEL